jgi:Ser/Thr protein kinase RdoA (MazF antagonist)
MLNGLHAEGAPVARPIATRSGQYVVTIEAHEEARHVVLFSAVEGKPRDENDRWSYQCGQLVGHLHACADRLPVMPERRTLTDPEHEARKVLGPVAGHTGHGNPPRSIHPGRRAGDR